MVQERLECRTLCIRPPVGNCNDVTQQAPSSLLSLCACVNSKFEEEQQSWRFVQYGGEHPRKSRRSEEARPAKAVQVAWPESQWKGTNVCRF